MFGCMKAVNALSELNSFLFSTRRKRVDLYLFVILIVALWAGRSPFNAWLVETIGERMTTVSTFLVDYPWLRFCLCVLIVRERGCMSSTISRTIIAPGGV